MVPGSINFSDTQTHRHTFNVCISYLQNFHRVLRRGWCSFVITLKQIAYITSCIRNTIVWRSTYYTIWKCCLHGKMANRVLLPVVSTGSVRRILSTCFEWTLLADDPMSSCSLANITQVLHYTIRYVACRNWTHKPGFWLCLVCHHVCTTY